MHEKLILSLRVGANSWTTILLTHPHPKEMDTHCGENRFELVSFLGWVSEAHPFTGPKLCPLIHISIILTIRSNI